MAAKGTNLTATISLVSQEEVIPLLEEFPDFSFRVPGENELATNVKEGELCIYMEYFAKGLKLPIQDSLSLILNHFALAPAQLTPNAFEVLLALEMLFVDHSVEWSIPNVLSLVTFGKKSGGFYCVMTRHSHDLGITGFVTSIKGWRSNYVFVTSPSGWNVPTRATLVDSSAFRWSEMTQPLISFFESLEGGSFVLLDVEELCYSIHPLAVKDRGDAKAVKLGSRPKKTSLHQGQGHRASSGKEVAGGSRMVEESEEEDDVPLSKRRRIPKKDCRRFLPTPPVEGTSSSVVVRAEEPSDVKKNEEGPISGRAEELKAGTSESDSSSSSEDVGADGPMNPGDQVMEEAAKSLPDVVKERRSKRKEESLSQDGAFDKDGYRLDKATNVISFRRNMEEDILPQWDAFALPSKLLYGLASEDDLAYVDSLPNVEVFKHACQLNVGASIHTAGLYNRVTQLESALHAKERANDAIRRSQRDTEAELTKVRKALGQAEGFSKESEGRLKEAEKKAAEEIKSLRDSLINAETHIDNEKSANEILTGEISRLEVALKLERDESKKRVSDHERLLASLKQPPTVVECSLDAAEAVYIKSERYGDAMNGFGEHGFNLLKEALLKDGRVDQSVLAEYDFDDCVFLDSQK